ncbi:MAG TPA: hypothetical protein VMT89_15115 [Candidatus Acidoferrales bacterium]|nr:hypothetical protein [Candidatus Acidoferrales bacterium]
MRSELAQRRPIHARRPRLQDSRRRPLRGALFALAAVVLTTFVACHSESSERPSPEAAKGPKSDESSVAHNVLPRVAAGISLGMTQAQAEEKLGRLRCRERGAELHVCDSEREQIEDLRHLEV